MLNLCSECQLLPTSSQVIPCDTLLNILPALGHSPRYTAVIETAVTETAVTEITVIETATAETAVEKTAE